MHGKTRGRALDKKRKCRKVLRSLQTKLAGHLVKAHQLSTRHQEIIDNLDFRAVLLSDDNHRVTMHQGSTPMTFNSIRRQGNIKVCWVHWTPTALSCLCTAQNKAMAKLRRYAGHISATYWKLNMLTNMLCCLMSKQQCRRLREAHSKSWPGAYIGQWAYIGRWS